VPAGHAREPHRAGALLLGGGRLVGCVGHEELDAVRLVEHEVERELEAHTWPRVAAHRAEVPMPFVSSHRDMDCGSSDVLGPGPAPHARVRGEADRRAVRAGEGELCLGGLSAARRKGRGDKESQSPGWRHRARLPRHGWRANVRVLDLTPGGPKGGTGFNGAYGAPPTPDHGEWRPPRPVKHGAPAGCGRSAISG
jgi:hypothetical protein